MTKVNKLLEMVMALPKGAALDISEILELSDVEISLAKIISEETEKERERKRNLTKEPVIPRGLGGGQYNYVNSLSWDDLLTDPAVLTACSERANVSKNTLLDFVLRKCNPVNWNAVFWMSVAYREIERAAMLAAEKQLLQKSLEKRYAEEASKKGRAAAEARHNKPGGTREKRAAIRAVWATGKYRSRALCASEEYEAIGFQTYETAKTALRDSPDPHPWPGKKGGRAK